MMFKLTLYHGSPAIVEKPEYGKGKPYNDYGRGFYCTEELDLAREWACSELTDGFVNQYEINPADLRILNLFNGNYTILHWLAILVNNRRIRISTPLMRRAVEWLTANFLLDVGDYDAIVGYRADDSYFSFARAFVNNELSLRQLNYAMKLGGLGEQFVLKSQKAFSMIHFVSCEAVARNIYFPLRKQRDDNARAAFRKELEQEDLDGLFIRDIIREGIQPNDPRLQ